MLRWQQDGSQWWMAPLAPLVLAAPVLTAFRETAGYLLMGLLLQPLALWVVVPVLMKALHRSPTRQHQLRWVFLAGLLPVVWLASCTYGYAGEVNERIAKLESLPVPAGAVGVETSADPWRLFGHDNILYRVPMPLKEAEVKVRQRFWEEGWVGKPELFQASSHFGRGGDCVYILMQSWSLSTEWSRSDNTHLRLSLVGSSLCEV